MTEAAFRRILLRLILPPMIALVLLGVIYGWQMDLLIQRAARIDRADMAIAQAGQLLGVMVDEETGVRGYLATGERLFLGPYDAALRNVGSLFAGLRQLASHGAEEDARIDGIEKAFRDFANLNEMLVATRPADAERTRLLLQQKDAMDDLRRRIADLVSAEDALRNNRSVLLASSIEHVRYLAILGNILLAAVIAWSTITSFRGASKVYNKQLSAVQLQHDWLHTTLKSIGDAVIACDAEGRVSFMNLVAENLTGWKTSEARGRPLSEVFKIVHERSREPVESPVDKVRRLGVIVGLANHTVLLKRGGGEVSIDDSGAPIRNNQGEMEGVVLVFRDIEERRAAERALAQKTAELEALLFHAPVGVALFDRDHRYLRVNRELAAINGFPDADHVGRAAHEIDPENAHFVDRILGRVFHEGIAIQEEVITAAREDSGLQRQWITWFFPVLQEHHAAPVSAGAIILETTEKWRAEEALRRAEKLAVVGRLTASIAHEMNNPLESVTNLLYLALHDSSLAPETRTFLDQAQRELTRASAIATQTLRFAKRSTAPAEVDLREILDGVLLMFTGRLSSTRIEVIRRFQAAPRMHGHQNELTQLFVNLIGNAIEALKGEGRLIVSVRSAMDRRLGIRGVSVAIADTGGGIPYSLRKKIWEPFFTTKNETGTGLGLWLVDEMVRNNRGSIRMRSSSEEVGHGTVFRVFLPLAGSNQSSG
jgi:PAS domain S-box-containing protein